MARWRGGSSFVIIIYTFFSFLFILLSVVVFYEDKKEGPSSVSIVGSILKGATFQIENGLVAITRAKLAVLFLRQIHIYEGLPFVVFLSLTRFIIELLLSRFSVHFQA